MDLTSRTSSPADALTAQHEGLPRHPQGAPFVTLAQLADGAIVSLRDARGEDATQLHSMFLGLSNTTRYQYFCAGVPANEVWASRFAAFACADGHNVYALVAEVGGQVIGIARFVREGEHAAEISIMLADAWQSRGLGGFVLRRLAAEARRRALDTFTGQVLWENQRMLRLTRGVFPAMRVRAEQGICLLTMDLWG